MVSDVSVVIANRPTSTTPAQIVLMECDFERVRIWSEPAQLIVIIVNISTR